MSNVNKNIAFFKNIDNYGDLYIDEVLLEDTYFVLSILKNEYDQLFICFCYEIIEEQAWIINEITLNDLINLLNDKIDIRSVFTNDKAKIIVRNDYSTGKESIEILALKDVDESIIPDSNIFLELKDNRFIKSYIEILKYKEIEYSIYEIEKKLVLEIIEMPIAIKNNQKNRELNDRKLYIDIKSNKTVNEDFNKDIGDILCKMTFA